MTRSRDLLRLLPVNRVNLRGFIVFDRIDLYGKAFHKLAHRGSQDKIPYPETAADGLDSAPKALIEILKGQSHGKQLVKHG